MNRPRLLLTRPLPDSEALAQILDRSGIASLIEPMLTIRFDAAASVDLTGAQAILLTSANGARALATARPDPAAFSMPVLAVGAATAAEARRAGFADVVSADGNVDDLIKLALARLRPAGGRLVHVAGRAVTGDLTGRLTEAGFGATRVPLYDAVPRSALSPEAREALVAQTLNGVVFFSPRSARRFVKLLGESGLARKAEALVAFCLSEAVAQAARGVEWRRVVVAPAPQQDALVASTAAELTPRPTRA